MPRTLGKRLWYDAMKSACQLAGLAGLGVRCFGQAHVPRTGPLLLLSNHQSHLDPVLIGISSPRQLNFVARQTLFDFKPLGWLIGSLSSIPIDRDGVGLGGIKETMKRLKAGEAVVLFPEGTRTPTGQLQAIKPGFCTLARRCRATLLPAAIDGAFDAWPRTRHFPPRPGNVVVQFGQPISPEEILAVQKDDDLVTLVESRIGECLAAARQKRQSCVNW